MAQLESGGELRRVSIRPSRPLKPTDFSLPLLFLPQNLIGKSASTVQQILSTQRYVPIPKTCFVGISTRRRGRE